MNGPLTRLEAHSWRECTDRKNCWAAQFHDRQALHDAAEEIDAFLAQNHAPPIWHHCSDIVHQAAGCVWDEAVGDLGGYDCELGGAS